MVKKVPLFIIFQDGMVVGPSFHWVEQHTLVSKWTIGVVPCGIRNIVGIPCRVRKVIGVLVFMYPCGLKESFFVVPCKVILNLKKQL